MRVVRATRFGGPEVLVAGEAPDPVAGPGRAVVAVSAADTLMLDVLVRRGAPGPWSVRPPYVPGRGVAGRVTSVGPGVDPTWVGRRVVARPATGVRPPEAGTVAEEARRSPPTGGYAEQAVAAADEVVPVPDSLGLREAAALVNDGMTALLIARAAHLRAGERVLVTPAGGGLGSLLVGLAHAAGATVVAAARGRRKLDLARANGADTAVDYTETDWTERVRAATGGSGVDVVLDGVGGNIGAAAFGVTAPGARFLAFGAPSGSFTRVDPREAAEREVTVTSLMELPLPPGGERHLREQALRQAAAGHLTPTIGQTLPLAQAATAHTTIESRTVPGKTLLLP